jgi:hypothetical protein
VINQHWNKGSRWQFVYGKNITGGMKVRRNKKGRKSKRYHNLVWIRLKMGEEEIRK